MAVNVGDFLTSLKLDKEEFSSQVKTVQKASVSAGKKIGKNLRKGINQGTKKAFGSIFNKFKKTQLRLPILRWHLQATSRKKLL